MRNPLTAAALAATLLLPTGAAMAASSFSWTAESGLRPNEVAGGMTLIDTSPGRDPVLTGSVLRIHTDAHPEVMIYRHEGAALDWTGALQIDARLMLGPGSSSNTGTASPRSHASIVFVDEAGFGNALFFAPDRVFLLGPGDTLGASATIVPDGDFHNWRVWVSGPGEGSTVTVWQDDALVLSGALFGLSPFVPGGAINFGDGTIAAGGQSMWTAFSYDAASAVPEPQGWLLGAVGLALVGWRRARVDQTRR
jgi:hypothetical protein